MAALAAPTLLATFTDSDPQASSSRAGAPHVSLCEVGGSDGRLAVAAVQGNGIWTYELSTSRPTTTFTVAPTTRFSSPAVSYFPSRADKGKGRAISEDEPESGGKVSRVTAVGIIQGQKKGPKGELWLWEGEEGSTKQVINLPHTPAFLVHTTTPSHPILSISVKGQVMRLDEAFEVADTSTFPQLGEESIVTVAIVPGKEAAIPVLVAVSSQGKIFSAKLHDNAHALKYSVERPFDVRSSIVSASISSRGHIIAADQDNRLYTRSYFAKSESESQPGLQFLHPQLHPTLLTLPSSRPLGLFPAMRATSSLLLALPGSDMPAVLSNTPMPTSTGGTITQIAHFGGRTSGSAVIGFTVSLTDAQKASSRTVIYVIEVSVPEGGVGLNVLLGGEAKAREYFSRPIADKANVLGAAQNPKLRQILSKLETGEIAAAETIFTTWLVEQDESQQYLTESTVRELLQAVFAHSLAPDSSATAFEGMPMKRKSPHAVEIVRALLRRKIVHDAMWQGGMIKNGLLPLGDWESTTLALQCFSTVSSSTLMALIKSLLQSTLASPSAPSLDNLLAIILSLPVPDPAYRSELKRSLSVEDATKVFSVLLGWAEAHVAQPASELRDWALDVARVESLPNGRAENTSRLPSLSSVIAHSSLLLDSHLPLFLSHPPAQPLIERMQAALAPLVAQQETFRRLRAPVNAALVLALREKRKRDEEASRREFLRGPGQGGKRAKGGLMDGMVLPEEAVNGYRVEDYVF